MSRPTDLSETTPAIDVAAGILHDDTGRVLIARRPDGAHQAGWWEFPGGKIDASESARDGLIRELAEELGIRVIAAREFMRYTHDYPDRSVTLHVYMVADYAGEPIGAEGQELRWEPVDTLMDAGLLPADRPIVEALKISRSSGQT